MAAVRQKSCTALVTKANKSDENFDWHKWSTNCCIDLSTATLSWKWLTIIYVLCNLTYRHNNLNTGFHIIKATLFDEALQVL